MQLIWLKREQFLEMLIALMAQTWEMLMARTDGSWILVGVAAFTLVVQPQGCQSTDSPSVVEDNDSVATYLDGVATEVIQPQLLDMQSQMDNLIVDLSDLSASIDDDEKWATVQQTWIETVTQWQSIEVLQIGALGSSLTAVEGLNLRDDVYSWPLVNPCRIDQATAYQDYLLDDFLTETLVSVRGLSAMEHLIYAPIDSTCPTQVPPMSDGVWAAFSESEIHSLRIEYALVIADGVKQSIQEAESYWANGFPLNAYENQTQALNAVYDAMFYVEELVKERKISHPMGLKDCTEECYLDVEGAYSDASLEFIVANLQGFERLFTLGKENGGLIEILDGLGEEQLGLDMMSNTKAAISQIEGLDGSLSSLVQNDPESVEAVLESLREVTTLLKWDLATVLQVQVPQASQGDND
jgi:predicted lipoprotein